MLARMYERHLKGHSDMGHNIADRTPAALNWQPSDSLATSALKQLGFRCHDDELSHDRRQLARDGNDPTYIAELVEDIEGPMPPAAVS